MQTEKSHPVILEMKEITKVFPGVIALEDVNLQVKQGEIHALCGENGAGKSTLMKVLSGVHPAGSYTGKIFYQGEEVKFSSIRDSEEKGIVIIHQELALIPHLTIAENMFMGNEFKSMGGVIDWRKTRREAAKHMAEVGLNEDPDTLIKDIGVGKQQLVEIAKALAKNVQLLILDEPTAALNEEESAHLLNLMRKQQERGITMIMISHKLNEIESVSDAVTVIRDGKTIETMYNTEGGIDEDRIISSMVGRKLENRYPERTSQIGPVALEVKDWWVRHPINQERYVCKGSNLYVRRGEIIGLAGLMGAGRTELARSLFGQTYGIWESGQMLIDGQERTPKRVSDAIKAGLAYLSEDRKQLGLNLLDTITESTYIAKPKRVVKHRVLQLRKARQIAEEYRQNLRTKAPSVDTKVGTLSGGNQQKVVLAKWMFTDPEILIIDEPTRGIDVGAKYEIYTILNDLAAAGKAIIVISSELPELLGITDRIYTIFEGEITGEMPTAEANQENLMRLMTKSARA